MIGTVQPCSCRGIGKKMAASLTRNGQMRKLQNLCWTFDASHSERLGSAGRQGLHFLRQQGAPCGDLCRVYYGT